LSLSRLPQPLARTFAIALSLAIFLALLPLSSAMQAQAASSCSGPGSARGARGCATVAHRSKAHKRSRAHRRAKHKASRPKRAKTVAPVLAPALCEDSSTPVDVGGSFSCADSSEPRCVNGSTPVAHGTTLLCPAALEETPSPSEAECEAEGCNTGSEDAAAEESTACEACEHPSVPEG
jgi:hypothetical protein